MSFPLRSILEEMIVRCRSFFPDDGSLIQMYSGDSVCVSNSALVISGSAFQVLNTVFVFLGLGEKQFGALFFGKACLQLP